MHNNVICLKVNELYCAKKLKPIKTSLPHLCFFEFTQELLTQIEKTKETLFDQDLHEISIRTNVANWFFKLTNRYHHDITTFMHITQRSISFSGKMKPYSEVHFRTPYVDINQLKYNKTPIKPIQINQLTTPLAQGLITKIQHLNRQYSEIEDVFYGIEPLVNEIRELDKKSALALHLNPNSQIDLLNQQSNELLVKMKSLESEVLSLSRLVLYKVFGIIEGDWISFLPDVDSATIQLQYDSCEVYSNTLTIRGIIITQAGKLGKREQSISIELTD